jgi:hypothetical protein
MPFHIIMASHHGISSSSSPFLALTLIQGLTTKIAVTIAMNLGVPHETIYVHGNNSSVMPNDTVSGGSTTSEAVGRASAPQCPAAQ